MNPYLMRLDAQHIQYRVLTHAPVWSLDDGLAIQQQCTVVKNSLLHDHKHDRDVLVLTPAKTRLDFKTIARQISTSRSQLHFATDEALRTTMHAVAGMVSPLTLEADVAVTVLVAPALMTANDLGFHAGTNTATVVISYDDLVRFLTAIGDVPQPLINEKTPRDQA